MTLKKLGEGEKKVGTYITDVMSCTCTSDWLPPSFTDRVVSHTLILDSNTLAKDAIPNFKDICHVVRHKCKRYS